MNKTKIRIRQHPNGWWIVESKRWFTWECVESFGGDNGQERALKYAKQLVNPLIIEVTK